MKTTIADIETKTWEFNDALRQYRITEEQTRSNNPKTRDLSRRMLPTVITILDDTYDALKDVYDGFMKGKENKR